MEAFNIDVIPFEKIRSIVPPQENDPKLYNGYILNNQQVVSFNKDLKDTISVDFTKHYYVLECTGIYEEN